MTREKQEAQDQTDGVEAEIVNAGRIVHAGEKLFQ